MTMTFEQSDTLMLAEGEKWDASTMRVNTPHETILANIESSIRRQLPQLYPHEDNRQHVAIVGGGWSLRDTVDDLRRLYFDGVKIVALNDSAKWLMERNLRPSLHVVLDARPENAEFVREPIPHCKYFFASQCAPEVFDMANGREVYLFHAVGEESDEENQILSAFYTNWVRVPTAGMVGITSIGLMRVLGFRYQHLFGIDGCYDPKTGDHHAYPQALNDNHGSEMFSCAGRMFRCTGALAAQAQNFMNMIHVNGDQFNLEVYGDGLMAHIMKTGATASDLNPVPDGKGD